MSDCLKSPIVPRTSTAQTDELFGMSEMKLGLLMIVGSLLRLRIYRGIRGRCNEILNY